MCDLPKVIPASGFATFMLSCERMQPEGNFAGGSTKKRGEDGERKDSCGGFTVCP